MATRTTAKKDTQIILPEDGADATVIETKDNKRVSYKATVREVENQNSGESEDDIDGISIEELFEEQPQAPPITKTPLEWMFDHLRYAVQSNGEYDGFFAYVIRLPDPIGSNFIVPCAMQTELGFFQFTSNDFLNFPKQIQKINNNSGGQFHVKVLRQDQSPMEVERAIGRSIHKMMHTVQLARYTVPNPIVEPIENGSTPNGISELVSLMREQMQQNETRFARLESQLNRPPAKSTLEMAIEQKVLKDILEPPDRSGNSGFEEALAKMLMMPVMVEKLSEKMFPAPKPDTPPPSMLEKVLELPPVQNAMNAIVNITEEAALAKINQIPASTEEQQQQPQPQQQPQQPQRNIEMENLINNLIAELDSDRPLDSDNLFLQQLQADYPTQADTLLQVCKGMEFDMTVRMLGNAMANIEPNPILPYLDIEATKADNTYRWNEKGEKLVIRLREFYDFVRSL